MDFEFIGYTAGFLTTIAFVPQVLRVFRRRSGHDLSWTWLVVFMVGLLLWLTYGVILHNWPMIVANTVTLTLCFALIWMKVRYKDEVQN